MSAFKSTFSYKLIYIFRINDEKHKGLLKIGDATLASDRLPDDIQRNCSELNKAAKDRINNYTGTAGVTYQLLHTELAIYKNADGEYKAFRDYQVHAVLTNSNIKPVSIAETSGREWFKTDLETAIKAINAVKNNQLSLTPGEISKDKNPIIFRPEQDDAIKRTIKQYKTVNRMLWNAKMRFGKTVCALEVAKRMGFEKTIIITHRPVVNDGWYEDFQKIFYDSDDIIYGSKAKGISLKDLEKSGKKYIYFASIQDLRGSELVGGRHEKNDDVYNTEWDFVIIDEAHEGTTTKLGDEVKTALFSNNEKSKTKLLELSGTPFNILDKYENNIYTWDYVMEQKCKAEWDKNHFGDTNPYEELPTLNIFTYDLGKELRVNITDIEDKAFNFREFFRTYTENERKPIPADKKVGDFVHEKDVDSFLNLMTKTDENSNYPFSTRTYQNLFKHTLWVIPGVKEARALGELMRKHPVFGSGMFDIVNVAGDGDIEDKNQEALKKVKAAIKQANQNGNYTITLSCGKLTTGVTVKEWTAVFLLSGSSSTSASNYLQTLFRIQSPANIDGKIKTECYAFDFAPDRTLKMLSDAVKISSKAGQTTSTDRDILGEFLNFCPVISVQGSEMKEYDTDHMLQHLKRAYADRAVKSGFEDICLYNDNLFQLDENAMEKFENLKKIVKASKQKEKKTEVPVNRQGLTEEEWEVIKKAEKKKSENKPLSPEEEAALKRRKEQLDKRNRAIATLRALSVRIPLLVYGANIDYEKEISINSLPDIVDKPSWDEFMPTGVTQELFKEFIKYYDQDVFTSAARRIRSIAKSADYLPPLERIEKITDLFNTFKNPDKETVLTPWRVVNMHMSDTLGGYCFYDEAFENKIDIPRFVNQDKVTDKTLADTDAKILEINSKTGLYPLYVVYSIFRKRCENFKKEELTFDLQNQLWTETVKNNIYIICKTEMAKYITRRTLLGFKDGKINAHYFEDLINQLKNKPENFISKITKPSYWNVKGVDRMEFDAIVGNPPYNETISNNDSNGSLSKQLFPDFIITAIKLNPAYISMITPSRYFTADAQDKSFIKLREFLKENNHFKKIYNYLDNKMVFDRVTIGSVNYFLFDRDYSGDVDFYECEKIGRNMIKRPLFEDGLDIVISMNKIINIVNKIRQREDFISITTITQGRNAFGIVGKSDELKKISQPEYFEGSVAVRCAYEKIVYTSIENIKKNIDIVKHWKIFTSKGNGSAGTLNDEKAVAILGKAYVAKPNTACTDSLIPIGCFDNEVEAINLQKYMTSKFLRFMVGTLKVSQNIYQNVYQFVPLQDFTDKSDIDWNKSVSEIDKQLYQKYKLSDEEISFIESMIKPME